MILRRRLVADASEWVIRLMVLGVCREATSVEDDDTAVHPDSVERIVASDGGVWATMSGTVGNERIQVLTNEGGYFERLARHGKYDEGMVVEEGWVGWRAPIGFRDEYILQ